MLGRGWNSTGCIGELHQLLRGKVLADPLQLSVLYFLEVYLFASFYHISKTENAKLYKEHVVLQEVSAGSVQRKEEGNPYLDGWNILDPVVQMICN